MGSQIIVVADVWRMDWRGPRLKKGGTIFEEDLTSLLNSLDVIHEEKREMKNDTLGFGLRNAWILVLYIHVWETDRWAGLGGK